MKLAIVAIFLFLGFLANPALAVTCDAAKSAWIDRCNARGHAFEPVACPTRGLVVRAPRAELDIEISAANERSFRKVGAIGLSPVGEFADWSKVSDAKRRALGDLEACVSADPVPLTGSGVRWKIESAPWWFLFGVAAFFAVARLGVRKRDGLVALAIASAVFLLRTVALPRAFFHQNGQGPAWVADALSSGSNYGPGQHELFGFPARWFVRPETGVWLAQSVLGALAVGAVFLFARALGARRLGAAAIAAPFALDPVLGRLAQSESYFGSIAALLALALAALALAGPRWRSGRFVLGAAAAGLFVSQAIRIHPLAWPAALFVPIATLLGPGSLRRRLRLTAESTTLVAMIVMFTSASSVLAVVRGPIGEQWLRPGGYVWRGDSTLPLVAVVALSVLIALVVRGWRGVTIALSLSVLVFVAFRADLLSDPNPVVTAAHYRAYWPFGAVLASTVAARFVEREQRFAAVVTLASLLAGALQYRAGATLPTDVREALFAIDWRERLEPDATVFYLERAERRIAILPLYDSITARRAPLRLDDLRVGRVEGPAYYYRSSLCSSIEARPRCDALEASLGLERVAERRLPAHPSMRWLRYDTDPVSVALYRITR